MISYSVDKPTRLCAATGRELKVGERIHSILIEENGRFRRKDYGADAWTEAPAGTIAHWPSKLPAADAKVKQPIDEELLFECFDHLNESADGPKRNLRFILSLLLMRRKRLIFVESQNAGAAETMILKDRKRGKAYSVTDPQMTDADMQAAQDELTRILDGE